MKRGEVLVTSLDSHLPCALTSTSPSNYGAKGGSERPACFERLTQRRWASRYFATFGTVQRDQGFANVDARMVVEERGEIHHMDVGLT